MRRALVLVGALMLGIGLALFWAMYSAADYSTPRSAARTFYIALATGDLETARASVADPRQGELMDELGNMIQNVLAAREAAIARFGESGQGVSGGLPSLEDLARADELVEGDSAALHPIDPNTLTIRLKRSAEQWKVDLFATFSLTDADHPLARRVLQIASRSIAEHARNIEAGQFQTPHEANTALQSAMTKAMLAAKMGQLLGL